MTNEQQFPSAAVSSRITLDDVRAIIGEKDPNQTNASKVRALLGDRGSFETIQKHLGTLRQERAAALNPPIEAGAVPALPMEVANQMWLAAWTAAHVANLTRSEKLAAERDAALMKLEAQAQDLEGLVTTVDDLTSQVDQAAVDAKETEIAHINEMQKSQADQAAVQAELDELTKELERTKIAMEQVQADAVHAAELAESGRVMMREELARLTDQVGELKAHLYKRAESAPMAVQPPSPAG